MIEEEQRRVFRYLAQDGMGADIIFACGTNGESRRLRNTERQRLIEVQADEIARLNQSLASRGIKPIEAWAGVTAETRAETLGNLDCAIEAGAHAAVIAPLSIRDARDIVGFFQRDVSNLFDRRGRWLPVFLYDNADIAVDPRVPHMHTRDVKRLSRLPFIYGVKVSASRRVLGNYTKGAGHFKDKGEFGIYVGNAMLMFQLFRLESGFAGLLREYWNRYLLHNELPIGVVSGPANIWPREWQRAWRACYSGDEKLAPVYQAAFEDFEDACRFRENGKPVEKMIACIKHAMKLEGVISSDRVAAGTPALDEGQRADFAKRYRAARGQLAGATDPLWSSRVQPG